MSDTKTVELRLSARNNPLLWLTWAKRKNGLAELRCVSFSEESALRAKSYLETNEALKTESDAKVFDALEPERQRLFKSAYGNPVVRCWTEQVEAEHVFGAGMLSEIMALAESTMPRTPE